MRFEHELILMAIVNEIKQQRQQQTERASKQASDRLDGTAEKEQVYLLLYLVVYQSSSE